MKKIFASFLTVLTLLGTTPVFALNEESNTQIVERFEDGNLVQALMDMQPQKVITVLEWFYKL